MSACCGPNGYDKVFNDRFARRIARQFRKRGLGRTQLRMIDFLEAQGIRNATVLEIGGGV